MPVHVEVRHISVHPLAHQVGQIAKRQNIRGAIERHAIFERETLARLHLLRVWEPDRESSITDLAWFRHPASGQKISAAQKKKNSTLTQPFMVKKAAFTRERSLGFTRLCS